MLATLWRGEGARRRSRGPDVRAPGSQGLQWGYLTWEEVPTNDTVINLSNGHAGETLFFAHFIIQMQPQDVKDSSFLIFRPLANNL